MVDGGAMLALIGPPGTGKTQIAAECVKYVAVAGKTALYTSAQFIFIEIRECYGPKASRSERDVLRRFTAPHLLVIDDVHQLKQSESEARLLFLILDERYGAFRPTILTANVDADAFRGIVGEPLYDRMLEGGGIIRCAWDSFRTRGLR